MANLIRRLIPQAWRPGRAAIAGLLGTIVYSLVMEGDKSLTHSRFSDIRSREFLQVSPRYINFLIARRRASS